MNCKKILNLIFFLAVFIFSQAVEIEKDLKYKKYTLPDKYTVTLGKKKVTREYQWEKKKGEINKLEEYLTEYSVYGNLRNYKNLIGTAPAIDGKVVDAFGVSRQAAVPLYSNVQQPKIVRYGRDGAFIGIIDRGEKYTLLNIYGIEGEWLVENKYIKISPVKEFKKLIFVDRKYQHSASLEKVGEIWKIRSMNPVTTGLEKPPYSLETPTGVFMIQEKTPKMLYLKEGSKTEIEGYAPYGMRFSRGAYLHGFPVVGVNAPQIEYSGTLGTKPRSHMCVRNATSHAKFLYSWVETLKTLVFVIE
ncbi:MAG: L,D-transpeptidase [Fusobacteriaceae bacterium]